MKRVRLALRTLAERQEFAAEQPCHHVPLGLQPELERAVVLPAGRFPQQIRHFADVHLQPLAAPASRHAWSASPDRGAPDSPFVRQLARRSRPYSRRIAGVFPTRPRQARAA
jgi:hypothetical protein